MKKFFLIAIMGLLTMSASAQIIRSTTSEVSLAAKEKPSDWNHSGMIYDVALGFMSGDVEDAGLGLGLGLGYRWHIANGVSWEVLRLDANTGTSHFTELLYVRATTGIRYDSNRIQALGGRSLFANFNAGYGLMTDYTDFKGFAYEIGAGIKLTRNTSISIIYQSNGVKYSDWDYSANWGLVGLKAEYQF